MTPVTVTWKLTRETNRLVIDYSVTNRSDAQILVLDEVVGTSSKELVMLPDRFVARYDKASDTVVLTAGYVPPALAMAPGSGASSMSETMPLGRPVAPGRSVSGTKRVALPLTAWHPDLGTAPLQPMPAQPLKAVVEVGWVPAQGVTWEQNPAADGTMLKTPSAHFVGVNQKFARGAAQSLVVN